MESESRITPKNNDNLGNVVKSFFKVYNMEDFNELEPNMQGYLFKIESYFQECENIYLGIKNDLDKISLSQRGVSSGAEVAWSTLNRHPILKQYIENRVKNLSCNVELISSNKLSSLRSEYEQLKNELDKMVDNYLELGTLRQRVNLLEKEKENLIIDKNINLSQLAELNIENNELKKQLRTLTGNNIKPLNPHK